MISGWQAYHDDDSASQNFCFDDLKKQPMNRTVNWNSRRSMRKSSKKKQVSVCWKQIDTCFNYCC